MGKGKKERKGENRVRGRGGEGVEGEGKRVRKRGREGDENGENRLCVGVHNYEVDDNSRLYEHGVIVFPRTHAP